MSQTHLAALQKKHATIEAKIHNELKHPARNENLLRRLKEEKLHLKEKIVLLEEERA